MDVTVKFFATYREMTGLGETTIRLASGATVGDLLACILEAHPRLAGERAAMLVAVNRQLADDQTPLGEEDEVALLPPVSGGGGAVCRVQKERIDPAVALDAVRDVRAGAVVLFLGTVRADPGVTALDYEAYEAMAVKTMEGLRSTAKEKFGVTELAVIHRTGRLPIGEASVAVACSAPHRQAAFRACEWAMEELKRAVPVWKSESD